MLPPFSLLALFPPFSPSLVFDQRCLCTGLILKLVTPQKYWWTKTILRALPPHSPPSDSACIPSLGTLGLIWAVDEDGHERERDRRDEGGREGVRDNRRERCSGE